MKPDSDHYANLITSISGIPLGRFNREGTLIRYHGSVPESSQWPLWWLNSQKNLLNSLKTKDFAYLEVESLPVCFCGIRIKSGSLIWGPIQYRSLSHSESISMRTVIGNDPVVFYPFFASLKILTAEVAMTLTLENGRQILPDHILQKIKGLMIENKTSAFNTSDISNDTPMAAAYRLKFRADEMANHSFLEEQAVWNLVKKGDTEKARKINGPSLLPHPLVLEKEPLKNEEYMAVSGITLMSRSAIEGGVSTRESFILSDLYLKKISECRNKDQIDSVINRAYIEFTELVRKHKDQRSSHFYIEECKKLISDRIFEKTGLSDICGDLNIQPTYLSRIFKSTEGQTVTDYIHKIKIDWACKMLKYTRKGIAEISTSLKFSTQSYFGKVFKNQTGMTPQAYRKEFYIKDR